MPLTLSERDHWKSRIAKRIDQRIETLVSRQDPTLLQRTAGHARARAYESLGIAAQQQGLEQIQRQREELKDREQRLEAEQRAVLRGTTPDEELARTYSSYDNTVEATVQARADALEGDILAESELGRQVIALRAEKNNLLDTVWLATSSSQIKELWEQVNALLERAPTVLEEKALSIAPAQDA